MYVSESVCLSACASQSSFCSLPALPKADHTKISKKHRNPSRGNGPRSAVLALSLARAPLCVHITSSLYAWRYALRFSHTFSRFRLILCLVPSLPPALSRSLARALSLSLSFFFGRTSLDLALLLASLSPFLLFYALNSLARSILQVLPLALLSLALLSGLVLLITLFCWQDASGN